MHSLSKALVSASLLLVLGHAGAEEASGSPTTKSSHGPVDKVAHAIQRGASAAATGIEHGVKAAAHGIERGAKATARGIEKAPTPPAMQPTVWLIRSAFHQTRPRRHRRYQ